MFHCVDGTSKTTFNVDRPTPSRAGRMKPIGRWMTSGCSRPKNSSHLDRVCPSGGSTQASAASENNTDNPRRSRMDFDCI